MTDQQVSGRTILDEQTAIEELTAAFKAAFPEGEARQSWLQQIYSARSSRFSAENTGIWGTGAVMIPTAFGLFVFAAGMDVSFPFPTVTIAILSVAVMFAWIVTAEQYRAFQNKSVAVLRAVENLVDFHDRVGVRVLDEGQRSSAWLLRLRVRSVRWTLLLLLCLAWVGLGVQKTYFPPPTETELSTTATAP